MAAFSTSSYNTLDCTRFTHHEILKTDYGDYNSYVDVDKDTKKRPLAQFDECVAKFGFTNEEAIHIFGHNFKGTFLDLSIKGPMLQWLIKNDMCNLQHITQVARTVFGQELAKEVIGKALYRWSAGESWSWEGHDPLWRVRIIRNGPRKTNFYCKQEGTIVPCESNVLKPWSRVVPVVQLDGLWYATRDVGMTYTCTDLLVLPPVPNDEQDDEGDPTCQDPSIRPFLRHGFYKI